MHNKSLRIIAELVKVIDLAIVAVIVVALAAFIVDFSSLTDRTLPDDDRVEAMIDPAAVARGNMHKIKVRKD